MILIIDSGSTKSDWMLVEHQQVSNQFKTMGFNPFFHTSETITEAILQNEGLNAVASKIQAVHYYGAGCSSEYLNGIVEKALAKVFNSATITVDHDLAACAYATYTGEPAISCILGTGSNSCYFDGEKVSQAVPSLAYVLGDEGSGNYFGKQLLRAYLYKKLPAHIHDDFVAAYNLDKNTIFENVYWKPYANVYLASFMKFISDRKEDTYFKIMITNGMSDFLKTHVCSYENHQQVPVHFVGSIAHYFENELRIAANELGIQIGQIIRKPITSLVDYHINQTAQPQI